MSTPNSSVIFNSIPSEYPVVGETLKKVQGTINLDAAPAEGSVLVKTKTLSLDPYLRGRMRDASIASYAPPFLLGEPISNYGTSEVIRSSNSAFPVGTHLYGAHSFSEYQTFDVAALKGLRIIDDSLPWTTWVGAGGMPGQTAWYGLNNIAKPVKGETIFISGAAGPVGQMVIAFCQRLGLKIIGSAGSDAKVAFLKDTLGVDVAFNYKTQSTAEILAAHPPHIYWDHVGGETLDAAIVAIHPGGRIVCCGAASLYNGQSYGVKSTMLIVGKFLLLQGFIVIHHDCSAFYDTIPQLLASGEIKTPLEHVVKGLDNGEAFLDLMHGRNFGKSVISLE